jgi:catechol 2,3-dioxygenase-like lactoylglutathione lyase family enzyme
MKAVALVLLAYFGAASGWLRKTVDRPKVTGIAFVRVKVSSLPNDSLYRSLFGGPLGIGSCISLDGQCYFVNLFQRIELVKLENAENRNLLEAVGFYTSDVKAMHGFLAAHGYKPGEIISDRHGGTYFEVRDPEGHELFFVSQPEARGASISGGPRIASDVLHAGWVVRDRGAMDRFYRDVLGFHVYWHGGMKEGETNWVDMQVPEGTDWIEYMLNVAANADKRTRGVMNHIALGVPDVRAAANQLEKAGVKLTEQPKIGRDGKWQLNLYDPDDTRVELMEFTPVEKPCCAEYTGPHPKP